MKPNSYESILKETASPAPDPQARLLAKRAALAEFARVNAESAAPAEGKTGFFQGLLGAWRLSRERQSHGSDVMGWNTRSKMFAGAASVCLAVVGFAVVWPMIKDGDPAYLLEKVPEQSVAVEPARGEVADARANASGPASSAAADAAPAGEASASIEGARESGAVGAQRRDERRISAQITAKKAEEAKVAGVAAPESRVGLEAGAENQPPSPEVLKEIHVATAEEIGKLADVGAGESLQRVPGLAVREQPKPAAPEANEEIDAVVVTGTRRAAQQPLLSRSVTTSVGKRLSKDRKSGAGITNSDAIASAPAREGRDKFEHFDSNAVKQVADDPVSTFSADVDTSSYSFVRKQLNAGVLPQKDAVRAEEMINYFDYSWPAAETRERPFRPTVVVSDSPWGKGRKLVHIGIKGYELDARQRPDANLVLLLDVSGSMSSPDKLPLVKESMRLMVNGLKPTDTVAIVVYAGAAGTVLPPTRVGEKEKILTALDSLQPGGSTAGAEGIELAYQLAEQSFRKEGVNRILLCTDGDFNVGIDNTNELKGFVERKREKGVFLSVLGFGQGNYRDELAQALAQNGNGVAAYIDTLNEAQKVLVQEAGSSLFTIAKDVKLQVEFNPATVAEYRLVGYETRALKREDFNNDAVDAGDVGSGHSVTAIYEITPVGVDARMIEPSRYAKKREKPAVASGNAAEYGFLKIRYKLPESRKSQLIEQPIVIARAQVPDSILRDVQFSTAVAGFAQLLRGGQYTGTLGYDDVIEQALAARGEDPFGYRNEFVQLVRRAQSARGM
jgi:Ca-activated chloride channel homolog